MSLLRSKAVALLSASVLVLAACGSTPNSAAPSATSATAAPPAVTIAPPTATPSAPAASVGPPATGDAIAIASGDGHTCALLSGGGVKCWGTNQQGQLGTGSIPQSATPVDVVGLASGVAAITAGGQHTCALTSGGGVKCWGSNVAGEIGLGLTTGKSSAPVDIPGLGSGVTAIAAGLADTCALSSGGGVKCLGAGGGLGNGTTTNSNTPVDVAGLASGVIAIGAGGGHACALTSAGGVKCWGDNTHGELGNGSKANSLVPVDVAGLSGVTAIAVGQNHTCALTSAGGVKCWGNAAAPGSDAPAPVDVAGVTSGVTAISAGFELSCALTSGGGLKCWSHVLPPQDVVGLTTGVSAIAAGGAHVCALTSAGGVACLGDNQYGELGDGTRTSSGTTPVNVVGLTSTATGPAVGNTTAITIGSFYICEITSTGGAKCWGSNLSGRLGNGSTTDSPTPVDVFGLTSGVSVISAGLAHACAVTSQGAVKCWGANNIGALGNGQTASSGIPVDVTGLSSGVATIALGDSHSCALTTTGGVKCWGGKFGKATTPVDVAGLTSGVIGLGAAKNTSCALTSQGAVKCWLIGTAPAAIPGLSSGITAIAVGDGFGCALMGGVKCWGSLASADLSGLTSGITAITAGSGVACALTSGGGVKCWGNGTLGNGTTGNSLVPVDVAGLSSGIRSISAGDNTVCAITSGGAVKCWGGRSYGTTPVDVPGL